MLIRTHHTPLTVPLPAPIDPAFQDADRADYPIRWVLLALYVVAGSVYFGWRATVFNPDAWTTSLVFFLLEVAGFLSSLLLFFVSFRRNARAPRTAPKGMAVDAFITTYDEDIDIVRRTVIAALRMDYPHETWLLDDGARREMQELAAELGCRYLSRATNEGAKAGNLNHALRHSHGDFVALFDADHCPQPDFLDRLLGYFSDPDVAFVQTPQDYFNLDSFQHGRDGAARLIWHEQSGFHHVEQPGRDRMNATTLCGCSCILRRAHLDLIGGFPTDTVTEDMHAAVKLQKLGLETVYHDEPLAFGIAVSDYRGFLRQRLRWGEGNLQVCRLEGIPLARGLTTSQNLSFALLAAAYVESWRKLAIYLAPGLTLLWEVPPLFGALPTFALLFTPYLIFGALCYLEQYGGFGRILRTEVYAIARLPAGLLSTWGLFRRRIRFRVTSKHLSSRNSTALLAPLLLVLALNLVAIVVALLRWQAIADGARYTNIPLWIEALLCGLCVFNAAIVGSVAAFAVRPRRHSSECYPFPLRLPLISSSDGAPTVAWTSAIAVDALTLDPRSAPMAEASLLLPGLALPVTLELDGSERTRLRLLWSDRRDRDELDQCLHAGRWHRFIRGCHEMTASPSDRIRRLLRPRRGPRPARTVVWSPVVIVREEADGAPELAYACADPLAAEGEALSVILFDRPTMAEGGRLCIVSAENPALAGLSLSLARQPSAALHDEQALAAIRAARWIAVVDEGAGGGSFDALLHSRNASPRTVHANLGA